MKTLRDTAYNLTALAAFSAPLVILARYFLTGDARTYGLAILGCVAGLVLVPGLLALAATMLASLTEHYRAR